MPHKSHEVHIKEQGKDCLANNDCYVPHHPEPGHGDNPHCSQHKPSPDCTYDNRGHLEHKCFGVADSFRHMHHAHINSGTHSFHGASKIGHLRNSGHKGAHRVGKR